MEPEIKYMKAALREARKAEKLEEVPITTFFIRDCTMAPAHIWHGSKVTYITQSSSLQSPVFFDAFLMAVSSAWESVFLSVLRRL